MNDPVLFLSAHLPVERSRQAGHKTAWRNLTWLAESHAVHLITFRSEGDRTEPLSALRQRCERIHVIDVTRLRRVLGMLNGPHLPIAVASRNSMEASRVVSEWIQATRYSRVHVEWSQLALYLPRIANCPRRSLYVHDVLSQWAGRKMTGRFGAFWRWESERTRRWELAAYHACTDIYVPSTKDRCLITNDSPDLAPRIRVLPLHFDVYAPRTPRTYDGPLRLLFWGALGREENAEAARWLCREILPRLRTLGTRVILTIAGSNPPADLLAQQSAQIEVTGFLENPSEAFARAHMAVAPLFQGAGVKVKVLECLAAGLPTLTTEIGAEGIEAGVEDGLITLESIPDQFVESIRECSANRERLAQLAEAAAAWGNRYHRDYRSVLVG